MLYAFVFVSGGMLAADVFLQLFSITKSKEIMRRITKVLLMPILALLFYLAWASYFPFISFPWLVIAGLLLGCAGDTFLIDHHHKIGFPLGLAAFFIGHIFYILQILSLIALPAWWLILLLAVI